MEIGQILRMLCKRKEVNLLEAAACPDHIHILVRHYQKLAERRQRNGGNDVKFNRPVYG